MHDRSGTIPRSVPRWLWRAGAGLSLTLALVLCAAPTGRADERGGAVAPSGLRDYAGFKGSYGRIVTSGSGGVAPFVFHAYADFSGDPDAGRGFRYYEYCWDFGDGEGERWGTSGGTKGRAKGAVAAHVFERPGTYKVSLIVRSPEGIVGSESFAVQVEDPEKIYLGMRTICVADRAHPDFPGAPPGSLQIATDRIEDIIPLAVPGRRILFRRGGSWTARNLDWPGNAGPVTIGAFGPASGVDAMGIAANAPKITVESGVFLNLDRKQNWRLMDLRFVDPSLRNGCVSGALEMQNLLFLRLRIEGFSTGLGWSHWNTSRLMAIDRMAVVSCDVSGSKDNVAYVGSERLALLGNRLRDARESHVLRVWQAFMGVISDNEVSGSSLGNAEGRHALKLHGPGFSTFQSVNEYGTPAPDGGLLARRTEYVVISGNVFGSSGPWPVTIGPQDALTDSLLSNIVFERNRIASEFGSQGPRKVDIALCVWACDIVIRNNVMDGSGSGSDYTGILVDRRGSEPAPRGVEIYNNTIFRADNDKGNFRTGIAVGGPATGTIVLNNLVAFPGARMPAITVKDEGRKTLQATNYGTGQVPFLDAGNKVPSLRDFHVKPQGILKGTPVPVYEDFSGIPREAGVCSVGAF